MPFNKAPTATFPSYSLTGGTLSIDVADLPGLTEAEANATTGDIRKIARGLLQRLLNAQNAAAAGDRSTKMVVSKGVSLISENVRRDGFSVNLDIDLSEADVAAE